jgi:hypothetical protein
VDEEMKIKDYTHRQLSMKVQALLLENKSLKIDLVKYKTENRQLKNYINIVKNEEESTYERTENRDC